MYCRKCGAQLVEDSLFCPKCGTKIEAKETSGGPSEPPAAADSGVAADSGKSAPEAKTESSPLMFSPEEPKPVGKISRELPAETPPSAPSETKPAEPAAAPPEPAELPPSLLPKPDGFSKAEVEKEDKKEQKKKKKKRRRKKKVGHPLDGYEPIRQRFRMGGCALLLLLLVAIPILTVGILGWIQHSTFVSQKGFESVVQKEANIVDAPEDDTLYWGWSILYEAGETDSEVAFIGNSWWLGGTFKEKVYFRGYQLILEEGARFEKGIDVNAIRFDPGDAVIEGELTGSIAIQE